MCFSAEASFGASLIIGTAGVLAIVKSKKFTSKAFCKYSYCVFNSTVYRGYALVNAFKSFIKFMTTRIPPSFPCIRNRILACLDPINY